MNSDVGVAVNGEVDIVVTADRLEPCAAAMENLLANRRSDRSWSIRGAFLATAGLTPIVAVMVTVLSNTDAFLAPAGQPDMIAGTVPLPLIGAVQLPPIVVPAIYLGLSWIALALMFLTLGFTDVKQANTGAYGELRDATVEIATRLHELSVERRDREPAFCEMKKYLEDIISAVLAHGVYWALGSGYINLLRRAHRAEEAFIMVGNLGAVIGGAKYDRLRIEESTMMNKPELLKRLDDATKLLCEAPPRQTNDTDRVARTILRDVRRAINDFRDDSKAGLVRFRNHLCIVTVLTGCALYWMLWLAIVAHLPPATIRTMTAYFLIGVTVGLFARLSRESRNDTAVDDYGLATHRLVGVPLLSGVAAIGGVLVTTFAVMAQGPMSSGRPPEPVDWMNLLMLQEHPFQILVAGVFGLTPSLLLDRLETQADRYKQDLRSSEALRRSEPTPSASGHLA